MDERMLPIQRGHAHRGPTAARADPGLQRAARRCDRAGILDDARWIFAHLGEIESSEKLAPSGRYVLGRSIDSAPAIEVASTTGTELDGLILDSAFADTLPLLETLGFGNIKGGSDDKWGGVDDWDEQRDGVGNLDKIAKVEVPVLLIHGEQDRIIPIQQAERLLAATQAESHRLLRIPGAGHNNLLNVGTAAYIAAIQKMIGK